MKTQQRKVNGCERTMKQFGVIRHEGVRKSLSILCSQYHKPLSTRTLLAEVSGMSQRGIHQAFVTHLGRPPGQVLRHIRINRARELLARFDYKIKVVAAMCGYKHLNSFEVAFKNITGLAPRQFHRRYAKARQNQNGVAFPVRRINGVPTRAEAEGGGRPFFKQGNLRRRAEVPVHSLRR